eukprot:TRINITY_DN2244_c0_g1_i1.p1 TRINITY_DN2244_c0_g1~~TRINITY_DN2244_c0_g1_i1.p1  ORF type:complete len:158 (+),score=26.16 TRINITY_DN2244_c0_g1_i1:1-474(+)
MDKRKGEECLIECEEEEAIPRSKKNRKKKSKPRSTREEEEDKDDYLSMDMPQSVPEPRLFQSPPTTKELQERNYYDFDSSFVEDSSQLIQINGFWRDFAIHVGATFTELKTLSEQDFLREKAKEQSPFLSQHILSIPEIGRAVQQECRDRSRMPSSA